ncbi:hypothetical protein [Paraburkholderia bonniea]|uniref:hypothetical protein n=1 Tax=Paraburkholderia bonniea TaxID=2152891 RepID=UPI001FE54475|nr:hypothetical protein [Paraburkholderia bonniea]
MNEQLVWVENQALENIRFHIQSAEIISKEANTTLTVFLAGIGGAAAYTVNLVDTHATIWLISATIVFGICLLILAGWIVCGCLRLRPIPSPTNEPVNLYQPEFSLGSLREAELKNLQTRINDLVTRNAQVADRLNRIRFCALISPIIASVVALVVWVSR